MSKQIQWYPGHMSKTLREFKEISKKIDVFIIVLDARAPKSTWLDNFSELIGNKKVMIVISKTDLVNKSDLSDWVKMNKDKFDDAFSLNLTNQKAVKQTIIKSLNNLKFKSLLPKIAILGVPNVGKSTLLNILTSGKRAKVEDKPGVTKQADWYQFENKYWILDTPGVLQPKFNSKEQGIILASIGSIKLDILPLEEVAKGLIKLLNSKGVNTGFTDIDIDFQKGIANLHKPEENYYKEIIRNFQSNKYGKIILDTK